MKHFVQSFYCVWSENHHKSSIQVAHMNMQKRITLELNQNKRKCGKRHEVVEKPKMKKKKEYKNKK